VLHNRFDARLSGIATQRIHELVEVLDDQASGASHVESPALERKPGPLRRGLPCSVYRFSNILAPGDLDLTDPLERGGVEDLEAPSAVNLYRLFDRLEECHEAIS
jgi:hypothetical protein